MLRPIVCGCAVRADSASAASLVRVGPEFVGANHEPSVSFLSASRHVVYGPGEQAPYSVSMFTVRCSSRSGLLRQPSRLTPQRGKIETGPFVESLWLRGEES